jgi:outer membrane protein insertion porin family
LRTPRLLALLAGSLLVAAVASGQPDALLGQRIVSTAYTTNGPVEREEIERLVELRSGEPLTETATAGTIRNLYATRRFSDVRIDAEPAPGGVAVTIHLYRSFRVNPLRFEDGVPISREELRRAIPFSEGAVFQVEALEQGADALKRRLDAEGYVRAVVEPEVTFDWQTFDARVVYSIEAGKPARVARALFDGELAPFRAEDLLGRARLDPGDRYRESRARADAERMTEFLHEQARLKGSVELIAAQPTEDGRVMPVYRVTVGPRLVFETRGIKPKRVERELHELSEGQVFDEDVVLQYVQEKRRELQGKGYYRAKVDYQLQETPETITVTVVVEQGPKHSVEEIEIAGNESVPDRRLRALLVTQERGLPLLRPGRLVDQVLQEDLGAVLGYYQTHGWVRAKVGPPSVIEGSAANRLAISIPVQEGPRALVVSRKVVGADHADPERLEAILQVDAGEPFNPNEVRQDVFALQTFYRDRGWREVSVRDEWFLSADGASAEVAYRIEEGDRSFFGKTIVRGNTRTDTQRIVRLVPWDEGDAFSEEKVLTAQRNLTRTGVFRGVEISPGPADPESASRSVELEVREGRPLSLLYGLGYQYAPDALENRNDPFALAGISYNNLFGSMRSAGIDTQYAPLSRRGRLAATFREPFLFDLDVPLTVIAFYTREPIQTIDIERLGTIIESSRLFGRYVRLGLRYEYQRIEPVNEEDLSPIEQENFTRFDQPIRQSAIGPNLFYDRRDDIIDPHDGYYLSAAGKYAFPFLTRLDEDPDEPPEARYTKVSGQAAFFQEIGRSVLAVSARAGAIYPYDRNLGIPVPLAERFFAGGRSTNRAFDTDLLGIPADPDDPASRENATVDYDTVAVLHDGAGRGSCAGAHPDLAAFDCDFGPRIIGGNGFLGLNAELRFPIFGGLGGTIFWDASQVWKEASDIHLSFEESAGLRQGAGLGLRYMTPIGPIRVEYAWPLDAREIRFDVIEVDEEGNRVRVLKSGQTTKEGGRFFFSVGYPF